MAQRRWLQVSAIAVLVGVLVFSGLFTGLSQHLAEQATPASQSTAASSSSASAVTPVGAGARAALLDAHASRSVSAPASSRLLELTEASLARGQGPAAGVALKCSGANALEARCGVVSSPSLPSSHPTGAASRAVPSAVHPAVLDYARLNWTDQAYYTNFGGEPVDFEGGSLAYDPNSGEVYYYNEVYNVTGPFSADFWAYGGTGWSNLTTYYSLFGDLPPALAFASLTWDPSLNGLVLSAGDYPVSGAASHQTWLFDDELDWENMTGVFGLGPYAVFSSVAWDPSFDSLVLVGGCSNNTCYTTIPQTWLLFDGAWYNETESFGAAGWSLEGTVYGSYASMMAYDAAYGEMVLYGGEVTFGFLDYATVFSNATWILTGSGWENVTLEANYEINPGYTSFGSMTWDGQLGQIVMFGGLNQTDGFQLNWTWVFYLGELWLPTWYLYNGYTAEPPGNAFGAMDTNCSQVVPMLYGGINSIDNSWVLEIPPQLTFYPTAPNPTDTNWTAFSEAEVSAGSGSGPYFEWYLYDFWYIDLDLGTNYYTGFSPLVNFSYAWDFGETLSFANLPVGLDYIYGEVFDFYGLPASNYTTVEVEPAVMAGTASGTTIDLGQSTTIGTSGASGGTGSYTYAWAGLPTGCSSTAASFSCTPTESGSFPVTLTVEDSAGQPATSSFTLTVHPAVGAGTASGTTVDLGQSTTIGTSGASGGTGSYTYAWAGLPTGCSSTAASFSCTPTESGSFPVTLTVTDTLSQTATSSFTLTVHPAVGAGTASGTTIDLGQITTIGTSGATGGTGSYTYAWAGLPTGCSSTAASFSCTPTVSGSFPVTLTVTDTLSQTATSSFTLKVNPAVGAGTPSATTNPVTVNSATTISTTATGGSGTYTYVWTGLPAGCSSTAASFICTPTASGTFSVKVTVTDSLGQTATATFSLTVSKTSSSTFLGLPATEGYALVGVVVIVVVLAALAALLMARRRKKASPPPPLQPADTGTSTPPSGTGGTPPASPPPGTS